MCLGENTSQAASVGFVRLRRTNPARGGLLPARKSGSGHFFDSLKARRPIMGGGPFRITGHRGSCPVRDTGAAFMGPRANTVRPYGGGAPGPPRPTEGGTPVGWRLSPAARIPARARRADDIRPYAHVCPHQPRWGKNRRPETGAAVCSAFTAPWTGIRRCGAPSGGRRTRRGCSAPGCGRRP